MSLHKLHKAVDDHRKNQVKDYKDKLPFVKTIQKLIDNDKKKEIK